MDEKELVRRIVSDLKSAVVASRPEPYFRRAESNLDQIPLKDEFRSVFCAYAYAVASITNKNHMDNFMKHYEKSQQLC